MKKFVVTFAGTPGSGKTPIATYLSQTFLLPIISTDAIRAEFTEDNLGFDREKFKVLRDERLNNLIQKDYSFILDGSVDREWEHYAKLLEGKFNIFLISIDLSQELLEKLHASKIYKETILVEPEKWIGEHNNFLDKFDQIVNLRITDENYKDRMKLSEEKLRDWIKS